MGPTLAELVVAVESRGPHRDVLDELGAAVELSAQLRELGDALVDRYVQAARADGRSWSQIGTALGVSKQAAQQRYVPMFDFSSWPKHFTADARDAVQRAEHATREFGHNYLGTEHLLLGLAGQDRGLAAAALKRLGVSRQVVRRRIEEIVGRGETASPQCIGITPRTKRALEAARREAEHLHGRHVRPEHLLLALAAARGGVAARILAEAGAHERAIRLELASLLDKEAPELAAMLADHRRRARGWPRRAA